MSFFDNFSKKAILILNSVLMVVAVLVTFFSITTGSYIREKENIQVGSVATKKYVAPVDTVDTIATERLKEEARDSVSPLYKHNPYVEQESRQDVSDFFNELDSMLLRYDNGESLDSLLQETSFKLPVVLTYSQYVSYNSLSQFDRYTFVDDIQSIIRYVYEQGVTDDGEDKACELAKERISTLSWSDTLKEMASAIMSSAINPNLVIDEESMEASRERKVSEVSDVIIKKNQKIVDEGEVITQDIYDRLELLNLIDNESSDNILPIMGSFIVSAMIFIAVSIYLYSQKRQSIYKPSEMLMLFTIYIITVVVFRLTAHMTNFSPIPTVIFAMLTSILIDLNTALVFNVFVAVIGTFIFNGDMQYALYFVVTGTFSALFMQYTDRRNRIIFVAFGVFLVNFITRFSLALFFESGYSVNLLKDGYYSAIIGVVCLIITIGSLPIWEAVFEANTTIKLLELANPNNELLRKLMIEAPGTYHHSLMVANLAERASLDIGANATLVRVGAYYHDIGKLKYPMYFSENQMGENPHDNLDPYSSAKIIIQHIQNGIDIANEKRLPKSIKSIIQEHQGTTLVKYFYFKATKRYSDEGVDEADFRYKGPIPESRESAIVMLADSVEAGVRSIMKDGNDIGRADEMIKNIIKDKLDDGQLNNCDLTMKDLETIRHSFVKVFEGMYHQRVSYPKSEELKEASKHNKEVMEKKEKEKEK